jgi:DNA polymerase-3 subunit gamma/tau
MYQVIARKYRPQNFGELIGQEHVRTTIENAINQNRIAHGYIFSGQRGTGKTTVARILARCLNCVNGPTPNPCGVCASCLEIAGGNAVDVIEIDAASNRGINEMRELRENVRYRPARDRYKVFIIDEAHQITSEAFNALLKTLEEPPEWVVFILCTTEVHKIPTTIGSRCQQFSFRSVEFNELMTRMRWICEQEGIQANDEALAVLAQAGEGSVRDSLSALDQSIACCGGTLSAAETRTLLGMFSLESLGAVAEALKNSDPAGMLGVVQELERNGHNLQHFCRELARYFRNLLVVRIAGKGTRLIAASEQEQSRLFEAAEPFSEDDLTRYLQLTLDLFKDLQSSLQPRLHLELGLLRLVHAGRLLPIEEALAMAGPGSAPKSHGPAPAPPKASPVKSFSPPARVAAPATPAQPPAARPAAPQVIQDLKDADWRARLHDALLAQGCTHTADAVEHSEVNFTGAELVITTTKMYTIALKNDTDLQRTVQQLAGRPIKITLKQGDPVNTTKLQPPAAAPRADQDEEVERRALSHPEVKRFTEAFPDAHVRTVRNLKT